MANLFYFISGKNLALELQKHAGKISLSDDFFHGGNS
jgi:hypothetical protein